MNFPKLSTKSKWKKISHVYSKDNVLRIRIACIRTLMVQNACTTSRKTVVKIALSKGKLGMARQVFIKLPNTKFHADSYNRTRVFTRTQSERHVRQSDFNMLSRRIRGASSYEGTKLLFMLMTISSTVLLEQLTVLQLRE
jgi:hypothetical protein